ncbi:DUF4112 domain-containing protein [Phenylobacterium sp.]|uniref:DUF4112 domain-containing protein n=1 Tax=Phenylobacterium sp. TaxID=1871053 RepID=UPI00272FD297|nr:DUF4112 domain-containing protein [Phenylobacterium sp.]MDP1873765.1 DUF4112 domain-containing protein [Phenylobacterium sp.]MDP3489665.1 DUF4112 domain-containing protein [Phenylobacterium sp.]
MFFARSHIELHNIRASIERTKRLSDNIIKIGPVGVGLDGLLTWIPWAGGLYSFGAGIVLLSDGVRSRCAPMVLLEASMVLLADLAIGIAPVPVGLGKLADMLFSGHKWAADLMIKHMEETIFFEGSRTDVANTPEYREILSRIKDGKERRRVVFLG